MRKRAMKSQNNSFILFFISGRKQKLQLFCYAVTVGMVFNAVGEEPIKSSLYSVCQRETPTGQRGPTSSKFMSKYTVSDSLAVNKTSHVNIYQSFLSKVQFKGERFKFFLQDE